MVPDGRRNGIDANILTVLMSDEALDPEWNRQFPMKFSSNTKAYLARTSPITLDSYDRRLCTL
jgi:hypothetical protein